VLAPRQWIENYSVVTATPETGHGYRLLVGRVGWPGYENRAYFRSGLGSVIRHVQPDILHLWEEPFSVITMQALWHAALWAPRAKVIFFSAENLSRDFRYPYRPSWFYAGAERIAHHRCAGATPITAEVAEVLRAKGFSKPIEIIPFALDLSNFPVGVASDGMERGRRATAEEVRRRFGMEPPVVAYAGRLTRQKGVDLLLQAAAMLQELVPSLVIIGEGPELDALRSQTAELGLGTRTRFLPLVAHDEIPAALAAVDVLVLPSRTTPRSVEQFGRVLIEGMAAGCAVIGSSSGAIPGVLGDAGIVFTEGSPESLAQAIRRALGDPGLGLDLAARGRRRVREHFTWDSVASQLVGFYDRLLRGTS
jgi:glycosyltransferase involved in cell wall biosynthesis